jgi:hypothetical protein
MPVLGLEPSVMPTAEVSSTDLWWGEKDSNLRPYAYEAYELTSCSIPTGARLNAPSVRGFTSAICLIVIVGLVESHRCSP